MSRSSTTSDDVPSSGSDNINTTSVETFPPFDRLTIPGGSISLTLLSTNDALLPPFSGSIIRGAFFDFLANRDPVLASILHSGRSYRPYSIEPLNITNRNFSRNNRGELKVQKSQQFSIVIKVLSNTMLTSIISNLISDQFPTFSLLDNKYRVTNLSYHQFSLDVKDHNFSHVKSNRVKVNFLTPTYFSVLRSSESLYFPEPTYFFMNLAKLWNSFNFKYQINEKNFFKWVSDNVIVNDYNTRTTRVYIGKGKPVKGFKGWVVYRVKKQEEYFNWLVLLLEFGRAANVGGNRTAGFGVIRTKWLSDDEEVKTDNTS